MWEAHDEEGRQQCGREEGRRLAGSGMKNRRHLRQYQLAVAMGGRLRNSGGTVTEEAILIFKPAAALKGWSVGISLSCKL